MKTHKKIAAVLVGVIAIMAINSFVSPPSDSSIRERVVKLQSHEGSCTGEQVRAPSGIDYILTAAHCIVLKKDNGSITAVTEDGKQMERRVIAEDDKSDLLLLEGLPNVRGLDIANSVYAHEHSRTFTHGGGMNTFKTEGEMLEDTHVQVPISLIDSPEKEASCKMEKFKIVSIEVFGFNLNICVLDVMEEISSAKIQPGSSGGPLLNDSGELIGVASASSATSNLFVRLCDIKNFISNY